MGKILIIEHRRYNAVADILLKSVINSISESKMEYKIVSVPRLRDLPVTVSYAQAASEFKREDCYIAYILLGTRLAEEEKFHEYPLNYILQDVEKVKLEKAVVIGTGIVSGCNNEAEAAAVAPEVGRQAAINCLKLLTVKRSLMQ